MRTSLSIVLVMGGVLILFAGASPLPTQAQDPSASRSGPAGIIHLHIERDGSMLTIAPTYTPPDTAAADTADLRYELTVERTGASTSRSRQSGTFAPTPGRSDTLSTARINAQPGDRLHLHLVVRRGNQIIAEISRTENVSAPE